jgi:hypothetical protein
MSQATTEDSIKIQVHIRSRSADMMPEATHAVLKIQFHSVHLLV